MSAVSEMPHKAGGTERLLLREFVHRMNNEFASAIGAVSVAECRCDSSEAKAVLASVRNRLTSHAYVQRSLQVPEYNTTIDLAPYLHQLCRAISESRLASAGIELSLSIFPVKMTSDRCWVLGLIVFELIANAARHAFGAGGGGEICLQLLSAGGSIACCITDNGSCAETWSPGRGTAIVEALVSSLDGTVDRRFGPDGSTTVVRLPIAD
ncbi:sensor histidine kinase [Bradyrhizobium elkanii]|uniref:sensor histidine kinase n=1 Tax=Bradyrhizobium elkanii TaxID=29448 RepID=UPI002167667A|nr:sensor histidine kinase [Bradyrhizobium elkanii]MCS3522217.1 two-component sensor histidine kinase [Bradyrhizobium elkanii]MCS4069871.1 two-component sensor histidine kinase [Bradyrhizobium elkanii]MCS4076502.1 two-component sensor histidine kinase [Bradyrhizobium elkanii]MCW2124940.1 two-component sensor histidine kinase [Bradyrhizobium elkanii]MCW2171686.1 two-component sensor histidine kinase [Bradyrhizobium elkanii]